MVAGPAVILPSADQDPLKGLPAAEPAALDGAAVQPKSVEQQREEIAVEDKDAVPSDRKSVV